MPSQHLHIISFTVPYPVDYGGAMDLFYKLPALQQQGVQIHMHCFDYGRGRQTALEKYCASVDYYERNMQPPGIFNTLPFIVSSRKNEKLLERLLQDDYPILMEGIHCTYLLSDKRFHNRKCFVRLHNVEYLYYHGLFKNSTFSFKKLYYWFETRLLKSYEKKIAGKATFFSVSEYDRDIYRKRLHCHSVHYIPLFIPDWEISVKEGTGSYCLYHGDLSIETNEKAAAWLLEKVFASLSIPFVIAGKNPSAGLITQSKNNPYVKFIANPSETAMQDLIKNAQVHIMPSYTNTGIKLKLLNALFNGRHCVVNNATVNGSGLEQLCHIADTAEEFQQAITTLYPKTFTSGETEVRKKVVEDIFNNHKSAVILHQLLFF